MINGEKQYDWTEVLPAMDAVVKGISDSRGAVASPPTATADTLVPTEESDLPF